jgi:hypothetical protein
MSGMGDGVHPRPHEGDGDDVPAAKPRWWRRMLPFAIAIALMAVVMARIDWPTFVRYVERVNHVAFAAFVAVFVLALLSADTLATGWIYKRSIAELRLVDLWVVRGASYLPSMLNHHLGQAWLTYFLSKAYGTNIATVTGATLLSYASWAGCLLAIGCGAVLATDLPKGWLLLPLALGVGYLVLLKIRPTRLAQTRLLAPLFEAGVRGHLVALLIRVPHAAVLFAGTWLPFWFFDVRVPFGDALRYVPIVMVAVTLPITPQGFGTRDALAAAFFERYAQAPSEQERLAAVAAATTSTLVALLVCEGVLGLLLLRRAMRLMGRER